MTHSNLQLIRIFKNANKSGNNRLHSFIICKSCIKSLTLEWRNKLTMHCWIELKRNYFWIKSISVFPESPISTQNFLLTTESMFVDGAHIWCWSKLSSRYKSQTKTHVLWWKIQSCMLCYVILHIK